MSERSRVSLWSKKKTLARHHRSRSKLTRPSESVTKQTELTKKGDPILDKPYFYGIMPREDIELLLLYEGDFVVRKTNFRQDKSCTGYCVSAKWKGHVHHIMVRFKMAGSTRLYYTDDKTFPTVQRLIDYYMSNKNVPIIGTGVRLVRPLQKPDWVIQSRKLKLCKSLGQGCFGQVWKSELIRDDNSVIEVAAKCLKSEKATLEERHQFFTECRKLRQLHHEHLVKFIGITLDSEPCHMVMELCDAPLTVYLHKNKGLVSWGKKAKICFQISKAMEYLAKEGIIHRDLAARNCLMKKDVVKISDLGMAREGGAYKMAPGTKTIPIKWTAPDALKTRSYSELTDVWSFGVVMWEVFTDGGTPYADLVEKSDNFPLALIDYLEKGNRLQSPAGCPLELTSLMLSCMHIDSPCRPKFVIIRRNLEEICSKYVEPQI